MWKTIQMTGISIFIIIIMLVSTLRGTLRGRTNKVRAFSTNRALNKSIQLTGIHIFMIIIIKARSEAGPIGLGREVPIGLLA
jgi:hypothetical protein